MKTLLISTALAGFLAFGLAAHAQDDAIVAEVEADAEAATQKAAIDVAKSDTDNWRQVDAERLLIFETTKGRVLIEIFPEIAPKHTAQFVTIARSGDYDGTAFHRVIEGFMAQGGDVFAKHVRETGLPNIPAEFTFRRDPAELAFDMIGDPDRSTDGYYMGLPMRTQSSWLAELSSDGMVESHVPHCQGVVSTARLGNDVNSANSQFFLMRARSDHLNKEYSPWGRIVDGQGAVQAMKTGDPQVLNPDILNKAVMAADLPKDERPTVWVQRTDGPRFQQTIALQADDTNVCDLPAVATVVED